MDNHLDPRRYSFAVQHDDRPPLAVVNKVGLPRVALPTLLTFPRFHAFWDGNSGTIWDANSSKMEEPNANEQEQTMGFHTNITTVQGISKGAHQQDIGISYQSYLSHMDLSIFWVEQV